jgi:glucose/arabinose dehydrogenase
MSATDSWNRPGRRKVVALASGLVAAAAGLASAPPARAATGCSVAYTITSQWPGGFGADVRITNLGDPLTGWTLGWALAGGQSITQMWNATPASNGGRATATNLGWNGAVPTQGSVSFGFNGTWSGSNPVPAAFTLNGVTCSGSVVTPTTTPTTTTTTGPPSDTTAPSVPANPAASNLTCDAVTFSWAAATDDVRVAFYDVYHDGQLMKTVDGSTLSTSLTVVAGSQWGLYVNARDAAGNVSQASATVRITVPQCQVDTQAPSTPGGLTATVSGTSVTLRWTASSDDVGVRSYTVYRGSVAAGTVTGTASSPPATTFTDTGLSAGTTYRYTVVAADAAGNRSAASSAVSATTGAACASAICAVTQVATDTDIPWGLVTLDDGTILYNRRDAHDIIHLDPATGTKTNLGVVPNVQSTDGEGGLTGLAVSPGFATDHWLYIMHTSPTDNRIVRIKVANDRLDTSSEQILLSGILRNKFHDGGRLRWGPDDKLYAATGDAQNGDNAQNKSSLNGKILRLNPDGTVPADNPFGTYVWSFGHRNPQGLAFDSQGRLWEQEFGNSIMDETNLIQKGGNYGWPACEGTSGSCGTSGFLAPKRTYPTSEGSCSGLAIVHDVLYIACQRGSRLYRAVISGSELTGVQQFLNGTYGRLRTVEPAPGGNLWLTTTNDSDTVPNNSSERIFRLTLG